jgi:hypothetical protein
MITITKKVIIMGCNIIFIIIIIKDVENIFCGEYLIVTLKRINDMNKIYADINKDI